MTISKTPTAATLLYFSKIDELLDYDSFRVEPIHDSHQETDKPDCNPKFWSVIGKLKPSKAKGVTFSEFPVADFSTKMYADLFSEMCTKLTSANPSSAQVSALKESVLCQVANA